MNPRPAWFQAGADDGSIKLPAPRTPREFQPGQIRWGAAVWRNFDDNFTEIKSSYTACRMRIATIEAGARTGAQLSRNEDEFMSIARAQVPGQGMEVHLVVGVRTLWFRFRLMQGCAD